MLGYTIEYTLENTMINLQISYLLLSSFKHLFNALTLLREE